MLHPPPPPLLTDFTLAALSGALSLCVSASDCLNPSVSVLRLFCLLSFASSAVCYSQEGPCKDDIQQQLLCKPHEIQILVSFGKHGTNRMASRSLVVKIQRSNPSCKLKSFFYFPYINYVKKAISVAPKISGLLSKCGTDMPPSVW